MAIIEPPPFSPLGLTGLSGMSGMVGSSILSRAVAYWKAKGYSGSGALLDGSGNGHHAQLGSTSGADTNDPLWLPYTGTQYLYLPGVDTDFASAPDAAPLDIATSIDVRVRVAPSDYTPGLVNTLASKVGGGAGWKFAINTDGKLQWTHLGVSDWNSSIATGLTDASIKWLRAALDTTTGTLRFYTGDDGTTWTQLGSDVATGQNSIPTNDGTLRVGALSGFSQPFTGNFYRAQIRNGIDGTIVFDADFTTQPTEPFSTFTEGSANAATVTINRSASGRKATIVERSKFLFGTDDLLEVADHANLDFALADSFTIVAVVRKYGTDDGMMIGKITALDGVAVGYSLDFSASNNTPRVFICDGTNNLTRTSGAFTQGVLTQAAGVRNTGSDTLVAVTDATAGTSTTDNTTATLANGEVLRIGRLSGAGTRYGDFEFMGAAIFRTALTAAELAQVKTALLA